MMKNVKWVMVVMAVLFFNVLNVKVEATSWAELEAGEVNDRAQVIVCGTYDFSKKEIFGFSDFKQVEFQVDRVYRGDVATRIKAGIEQYDLGWAEEFQAEGGEFLLFLEKGKKVGSLLPVGGPNGMIQVKEGEVIENDQEKQAVYETVLQGEFQAPHAETLITFVKRTSFMTIFSVAILLLLCGILMKRRLKKS